MSLLSIDLGTRSMGFALLQISPFAIQRVGIVDLGTNVVHEAVDALHKMLTPGGDLESCIASPDLHIVMELQPVNSAGKCVAAALQMFALCHRIPVATMPANRKLHLCEPWYAQCDHNVRADSKLLSLALADVLLNAYDKQAAAHFAKQHYKQRTDIADALVQGAQWIQEQKLGDFASLFENRPLPADLFRRNQAQQVQDAHPDEFATHPSKKRHLDEILSSFA
jgi:hypothetical protein